MNDEAQYPLNQRTDPNQLFYVLRLWCIEGHRGCEWRASLESPETGKRIAFASLEQMFGYLMDQSEKMKEVQKTGDKR